MPADGFSTSKSTSPHLLLVPIPAWGHIRPLCILAGRIIQERPDVIITMISAPNFLERTLHELENSAKGFGYDDKACFVDRIRVIAPFQIPPDQPKQGILETISPVNLKNSFATIFNALISKLPITRRLIPAFQIPAGQPKQGILETISLVKDSFATIFETLLSEQPITCLVRGTTFPAVPPPSLVILDFFWTPPRLHEISKSLAPSVPVIAWVSSGGATLLRMFGPEASGGLGELGLKAEQEATRTGRDVNELGNEMLMKVDGSVVEITGLPKMYDWEFFPQNLPLNVPRFPIVREGAILLREADAVLAASANAYEAPTLDAIRSWIQSTNKPFYSVGPLLPPGYGAPQKFTKKDREIEHFLEDKLEVHGKGSVLFISFGTMFWPTVPEYVEELIDALIECQVPFIFGHASPLAKLPESVKHKAEASGLGLLSPWTPQHAILNHPATGWFLTHGGHNSVIESLGSGVPMIFWPFNSDQPTNAIHVTTNLKAGIELLQIRTGYGSRPLKRHEQDDEKSNKEVKETREAVRKELKEVFESLGGEKGIEMAANAKRLKADFESSWNEEGYARRELREILNRWI